MPSFILEAKNRSTEESLKKIRNEGMIPAILYGRGLESKSLMVNASTFNRVFKEAGQSSLVDLQPEGGELAKVLIQAVQKDVVSDQAVHIDFYQVDMTKKIINSVELTFVGEAPVVKKLSGILVKSLDHLEVQCLPQDLVSEIRVDLSGLATFEDIVRVADLEIPAGLEILANPDEVVVTVTPPRIMEEEKAGEEEKVVEEEKKDDEEKAESVEDKNKEETHEGKKTK